MIFNHRVTRSKQSKADKVDEFMKIIFRTLRDSVNSVLKISWKGYFLWDNFFSSHSVIS